MTQTQHKPVNQTGAPRKQQNPNWPPAFFIAEVGLELLLILLLSPISQMQGLQLCTTTPTHVSLFSKCCSPVVGGMWEWKPWTGVAEGTRVCDIHFEAPLSCCVCFESVSCLLCTSLSYAVCAVFVGCPTFLAHLIPSFYNQWTLDSGICHVSLSLIPEALVGLLSLWVTSECWDIRKSLFGIATANSVGVCDMYPWYWGYINDAWTLLCYIECI